MGQFGTSVQYLKLCSLICQMLDFIILFSFFELYFRYLQELRAQIFLFLQHHPVLPLNCIKSLSKFFRNSLLVAGNAFFLL